MWRICLIVFTMGWAAFAETSIPVNLKSSCWKPQNLIIKGRSNFDVNLIRYSYPENYNKGRLIVIFPPTGGVNNLDRGFAKEFCRKGFSALILDSYTGSDEQSMEDLGVHQRTISKGKTAMRIVRNTFRHESFSFLGSSAGGILASTLVDDFEGDLDAIFTVVAGSPLRSVIARAGEEGLAELREKRMRHFGFRSVRQYEAAIARNLQVSIPSAVSSSLRVGMLVSRVDKVVPTPYQQHLARQWEPDLKIEVNHGHVAAVLLSAARYKSSIVDFFLAE